MLQEFQQLVHQTLAGGPSQLQMSSFLLVLALPPQREYHRSGFFSGIPGTVWVFHQPASRLAQQISWVSVLRLVSVSWRLWQVVRQPVVSMVLT